MDVFIFQDCADVHVPNLRNPYERARAWEMATRRYSSPGTIDYENLRGFVWLAEKRGSGTL